jgi:hypothetical protein
MEIKQSDIDRFSKNINQTDSGCFEWTGAIFLTRGYGRFWFNNKSHLAHRFAWVLKNGEIPINQIVCHSCDNRICVNSQHLWLGSHLDNARDRVNKGRSNHFPKTLPNEIEELIAELFYTTDITQKELSIRYNVTQALIGKIIRESKLKKVYIKKLIPRSKKISPQIRNEILDKRKSGESIQKLAHFYNVTKGAIEYHLYIESTRETMNKNQRIRRKIARLNK